MTSLGPYRFDASNQRLYHGSSETRLTRKAAAILDALIKRPNEIVTHDELLDSVWRGVHVQPEVLKVYIAEIRRALRESPEKPRFLETIHRQGYRFISSVNESEAPDRRSYPSEPLVGRAKEIAALWKIMRKAADGHRQL